jgi:hypothetical protein
MYSYRLNFNDVRNEDCPKAERELAKSENDALDIFIQKRLNENWTHDAIFNKSQIIITRDDTNERFWIDEKGQLVKGN